MGYDNHINAFLRHIFLASVSTSPGGVAELATQRRYIEYTSILSSVLVYHI